MLTKRGVLAYLAKVYDPLGVIPPVLLEGKLIFRKIYDAKASWDFQIHDALVKRWQKWDRSLPSSVSFSQSIPVYLEPISELTLHLFGDASGRGVCAAIYAVVRQNTGIVQGLITAKSRLAKTG